MIQTQTRAKIESIKFLNFGHIIEIEQSDQIKIPDRIDHLPPEMLKYLMKIGRFNTGQTV